MSGQQAICADHYYDWSHYTNPQLTKLIKEAEVTTSQSARAQIQQIIMTYSGGGFEYFYKAVLNGKLSGRMA